MISAIVTLYENCKLTPEKNFVVDEIATYLNTLTKKTATYNFIAHDLNITISANESMGILSYSAAGKYNYAEIRNSNESKPVRYFITDRRFNAQGAVTLTLLMDTLNSFALGTDYAFSENTRTFRQHKDRFSRAFIEEEIRGYVPLPGNIPVSVSHELWQIMPLHPDYEVLSVSPGLLVVDVTKSNSSTDTIIVNIYGDGALTGFFTLKISARTDTVYPVIDKFPEGLAPITERIKKQELLTGNAAKTHYLVYETKDGKIRSLLRAKNLHGATISELEGDVPLTLGVWFIFAPHTDMHLLISFYLDERHSWNLENDGVSFDFAAFRATRVSGTNSFTFEYGKCRVSQGVILESVIETQVNVVPAIIHCKWSDTSEEQPPTWRGGWTEGESPDNYTSAVWNRSTNSQSSIRNVIIYDLSTVDLYSPNINKIIAIPFLPDLTAWRYSDDENSFVNERLSEIYRDTTFDIDTPANHAFTVTGIKSYTAYDTKLYSSEFYFQKLGYDSFGLMLKFENIKRHASTVGVRLQSTSTMTSALMLKITNENAVYDVVDEDINGVLICRRNNEMPIYTSEYLNYLQVGYNYDKKAKDRTLHSAKIQVGAKVAGGVAQGLIGATRAATGDLIAGLSSFAGGVASVVSAVDSYNNQVASAEESIERKIAELERQTANIGTADDFELCEGYGGDTFKLYTYQAPERILNAVDRMFRLYGYKCDEFGVPNVTSRKLWNFIQCNPEFVYSNAFIVGLPAIICDTLVNKYREGVTFLHGETPSFELIGNNYEALMDA